MRFLFLNQFYPPDGAPTGRYLHEIAVELLRRGHDVTALSSRRAYATGEDLGPGGRLEGVEVERVSGVPLRSHALAAKAAGHLWYFTSALARAVLGSPRHDLVLCATSPPFLGLAGALATRLRATPHVEWVMDLYPDAIQAHWPGRLPRPASAFLEALARFQLRRPEVILVPGESMARRAARHSGMTARIETVPLWSTLEPQPERSVEMRRARGWAPGQPVFLYSGNMGRGHRFGEFLAAARHLGPNGPVWAFIGTGPRRSEIEEFRRQHPDCRVELLPAVAPEDLAGSLSSGDVHLVSVSNDWRGLIVPSKLQAAFATARPVILVGGTQTETADWIRESGGGWVVEEGDVDALLRAVAEASEPAERHRRGRYGEAYARTRFDPVVNRQRIVRLLEESAASASGRRSQVGGSGALPPSS